MPSLYRPTVHHLGILPDAEQDEAFTRVEEALAHLARWLPRELPAALHPQVAAARRRGPVPRDARLAFVHSTALYPVPGHEPLRVAFFAYREGLSLILHFIWHWDGEGNADTFRRLSTFLWRPSHGHLAEGLLLTAVLDDPKAERDMLARELLAALGVEETALAQVPLMGATLHVPRRRPLTPAAYPALLLFHAREVEETPAADRFATVIWPLVVLYIARVERVYLHRYRGHVDERLRQAGDRVHSALHALFAQAGRTGESWLLPLRVAQSALQRITAAQHALYQALSDAELHLQAARRDLTNLVEVLEDALTPWQENTPLTTPHAEAAARLISAAPRRMVAQMETDVTQARTWAQRAARAVDALRTRADLLQARYEWLLNWVVGLVGSALAAAQLVDADAAAVLRAGMNRLLTWAHVPVRVAETAAGTLLVRGFVVLVTLVAVFITLQFVLVVGRRGERKEE